MTGDDLRALIERLELSQLALARMMGVDGRTVRRWIAGEVYIPGPAIAYLRLIDGCPAALRWALRAEALA